MQTGRYEEELRTGGTLVVCNDDWYIQYYFPGPDLRYNGTFKKIYGYEIDSYIVALKDNYKKFTELYKNFDRKNRLTIDADKGMSIQLGGYSGSGVYMFHYHKLISSQEDLHNVIRDLIYAKNKALIIQRVFANGDLNSLSRIEYFQQQDPDLDGYFETLVRIKNEFSKYYRYNNLPPFDVFINTIQDLFSRLKQKVSNENNSAVWNSVLEELVNILIKAKRNLTSDNVYYLLSFIDFSSISQELFDEISQEIYNVLQEQNNNNNYHVVYAYLIYQILKYGAKNCSEKIMQNLKIITPSSSIAVLRYIEVMNSCKIYDLTPIPIDISEVNSIQMPQKPQRISYYKWGFICVCLSLLFICWFIINVINHELVVLQLLGYFLFTFCSIIAFDRANINYSHDCKRYNLAVESFKDYQLQEYTNSQFEKMKSSQTQKHMS